VNLGNSLAAEGDFEAAIAPFTVASQLRTSSMALDANLLHAKQSICEWNRFQEDRHRLTRRLEAALDTGQASQGALSTMAFPYTVVMLAIRERVAFEAVRAYATRVESSAKPLDTPYRAPTKTGLLRIGFVSADFREHPLAHLMHGVFVSTGPRFQSHAFSLLTDKSKVQRQIAEAAASFTHVAAQSDHDAAKSVSDAEIDVLIDLNGYTRGHRPRILAMRPAAVQVMLGVGYPGTSGLQRSIDYFVGDRGASSPMQQRFFTERLVLLPFCYQPNYYAGFRPILKYPIHQSLVLGMYNRNFKVDPAMFQVWTNAMRRVDEAILEMLSPASSAANLQREAAAAAIHPRRFKPVRRAPRIAHLHRTAAADLFLDSHYYNAHTTGSDALWAGLPLMTLRGGGGFASRVSTSLLAATGLPETSVASHKEYEDVTSSLLLGQ